MSITKIDQRFEGMFIEEARAIFGKYFLEECFKQAFNIRVDNMPDHLHQSFKDEGLEVKDTPVILVISIIIKRILEKLDTHCRDQDVLEMLNAREGCQDHKAIIEALEREIQVLYKEKEPRSRFS